MVCKHAQKTVVPRAQPPTDPFTYLKPCNPSIHELYAVRNRRLTYFKASLKG